MVSLSRGFPHSNSLEMFLTSVDTAVKVRNTVNTKRTGYSVAGPHSSQICRCPFLNVRTRFVSLLHPLHSGSLVALNKTQSSKLGSWSARLLCRMVSFRRRPDETPVDHWRRRHRTGSCSRRAVWFGSPAALSVAKTPLRWSPCEIKVRLLGPQNAHDSRSGMVAPCAGSTR